MYNALIKDTNELVDIMEVLTEMDKSQLEFICPHCKSQVKIRNGVYNAPHFYHMAGTACEVSEYDNNMSEWHRNCQLLFPKQFREIRISSIIKWDSEDQDEWSRETHIADICIGNYVIEFQHSPMDPDTFNERTVFYTELGYKLIWIFDFSEKDIEEYDYNKWKINHAPKTALYYNPKDYKKDRVAMCFEDSNCLLHQICWARPDSNDPDYFSWSRVCTKQLMNDNIYTIEDLAEHLMYKCKAI